MVTIKLRDEKSILVKIEVKKGHPDFDDILGAIKSVPGRYYSSEDYAWVVSKENARLLCEQLDKVSRIAFLSKESEIFGTQPRVSMPKFEIDNTYLDEMALPPYPYQVVGISFLHDIKRCIIGDAMGLGKTPSILGAIWKLHREGNVKKALITVPSSVLYQWNEEIDKFIPMASRVIIDGPVARRQKIYKQIDEKAPLISLVGHEMMRNDIETLRRMQWDLVAIDEGHRIRNYETQLTKAAKKLEAEYKFIATGTPIQNRPEEIWSLFDFIEPSIFGNWFYFRKKYVVLGEKFGQRNAVIGYCNLDELYDRIGSRMLRRLKEDVDVQLPRLLINNHRLEMTSAQERVHAMIENDLQQLVEVVESYRKYNAAGDIVREHPSANRVLGLFTMLQEVADSPELLMMSGSQIAEGYLPYCDTKSNKVDELKDIVKDILHYEPKTKMIIFSQYERMQQILARELEKIGHCVLLNGKMNAAQKQQAQNDFKFDPEARFFLSTDSGNYGINMQVASYVINVDIPWNPAVWKQRYSRAHRIGSEHEHVNVINLISMNSIDESIYNTMYNRSLNADMLTDRDQEERKILATPDNANIKRLVDSIRRGK